ELLLLLGGLRGLLGRRLLRRRGLLRGGLGRLLRGRSLLRGRGLLRRRLRGSLRRLRGSLRGDLRSSDLRGGLLVVALHRLRGLLALRDRLRRRGGALRA